MVFTSNPSLIYFFSLALFGSTLVADQNPDRVGVDADSTAVTVDASLLPAESGSLPFDPALIGLAEFPQPMRSGDDFQRTLELIDERIEREESALTKSIARHFDETSPLDAATDDPPEVAAHQRSELFIAALRELRFEVLRNASLKDRLEQIAQALESQLALNESAAESVVSSESPPLVSELDQKRAELALKRAVEAVAETRIETARGRYEELNRALNAAVRERRQARDLLTAAAENAHSETDREALEQELRLARLNELLLRQRVAAAERRLGLARQEDALAEAEQEGLAAMIAALEPHVQFSQEALDRRLEDLAQTDAEIAQTIDDLLGLAEQAEVNLYQAKARLADETLEANRPRLQEWVAARQAEMDAARASVDSLMSARNHLAEMNQLWTLRYRVMQDPAEANLPSILAGLIADANAVVQDKDLVESRMNALRSIQLAQQRRLRESDLDAGVREALLVRGAALDLSERHGRQLLETQDALIALLRGMRHQFEPLVEQQVLALQLLQARETLTNWWHAEVLVIDDQSILVRELIVALAMFAVVLAAMSLVRAGARRALKRKTAKNLSSEPLTKQNDLRLALSAMAGNTSQLFVLIVAFFIAMVVSGLASFAVKNWLWNLVVVACYVQIGIWINAAAVDYFTRRRTRQEMRDPSTVTGYGVMMVFVRVGIWLMVLVSLLAYFRYPVAGLIGALGVGSLAVAFAVQNILGDVFSSMAIILDKPFRVGDFIMAGDTIGVVEYIGVKTTRIRSLSGERVVLSNSDLLSSRIHNFKHFKERRVVFRIGVVYQTPRARLEEMPGMLRAAVEEQPQTRFDRAHFVEYGDFALLFEVVYFALTPDYLSYMDIQQGINLAIHRRFEEAGIQFAYPTQELILRRGAPTL